MENGKDRIQQAAAVIALVIGGVSIYLQMYPPQTTQQKGDTILLFIGSFLSIGVYFIFSWLRDNVKKYLSRIKEMEESVVKMRQRLDLEEKFHILDKRILVMEHNMNKKGELDPRIPLFIMILVFFYLYLRSLGLVG